MRSVTRVDLTGQKFNRLTVIAETARTHPHKPRWLCRCDCGAETRVTSSNLKQGVVKSCGCARIGSSVVDLTGQRYGRLIVIELAGRDTRGRTRWLCRCDCGATVTTASWYLRGGSRKSCGCLQREVSAANRAKSKTHGHCPKLKPSRTYATWSTMIQRCNNPKHVHYARYGGAGVAICERWLKFENFLADMGERPDGHSLDRLDGSKGYDQSNCRWSTPKSQANNRRNNRKLTLGDMTDTVVGWSERTGLSILTIRGRLRAGWPIERILTEPSHRV